MGEISCVYPEFCQADPAGEAVWIPASSLSAGMRKIDGRIIVKGVPFAVDIQDIAKVRKALAHTFQVSPSSIGVCSSCVSFEAGDYKLAEELEIAPYSPPVDAPLMG